MNTLRIKSSEKYYCYPEIIFYSEPDCTGDLDLLDPEADLLGDVGDPRLEEAADPVRREAGVPERDLEFPRDPGVADRERGVPEAFDPERDRRGDDGALDPDLDREPAGDLDLDRDLDPEAADLDLDLEPPEPDRDLDLDRLCSRSFPDPPFSSAESLSEPILLRLFIPPSLSLPLAIFNLSSSLSSDDETFTRRLYTHITYYTFI